MAEMSGSSFSTNSECAHENGADGDDDTENDAERIGRFGRRRHCEIGEIDELPVDKAV